MSFINIKFCFFAVIHIMEIIHTTALIHTTVLTEVMETLTEISNQMAVIMEARERFTIT